MAAGSLTSMDSPSSVTARLRTTRRRVVRVEFREVAWQVTEMWTTRTEVESTIISGNTGGDVDFLGGITNSFLSLGYNLIGLGTATGNFNVAGDQIDVTDPGLEPLADNGGPTMTHALMTRQPCGQHWQPDIRPIDFAQRSTRCPVRSRGQWQDRYRFVRIG